MQVQFPKIGQILAKFPATNANMRLSLYLGFLVEGERENTSQSEEFVCLLVANVCVYVLVLSEAWQVKTDFVSAQFSFANCSSLLSQKSNRGVSLPVMMSLARLL